MHLGYVLTKLPTVPAAVYNKAYRQAVALGNQQALDAMGYYRLAKKTENVPGDAYNQILPLTETVAAQTNEQPKTWMDTAGEVVSSPWLLLAGAGALYFFFMNKGGPLLSE